MILMRQNIFKYDISIIIGVLYVNSLPLILLVVKRLLNRNSERISPKFCCSADFACWKALYRVTPGCAHMVYR